MWWEGWRCLSRVEECGGRGKLCDGRGGGEFGRGGCVGRSEVCGWGGVDVRGGWGG